MHVTPERVADPQTSLTPPPDPDDAAHVARLGAQVAYLVQPHQEPALLATLARIRLGLSQAEVAEAAGLGRGVVARIEAGRTRCTDEHAAQLAPVLDVPSWWLTVGAGS